MGARAGSIQTPAALRIRLRTWRARMGVLALVAFASWSMSERAAAETPGSTRCRQVSKAATVDYLTGIACPPTGFARTMGYEPVLVETGYGWRYTKPDWAGGACSGPLADTGPFWDFTLACRAHDYGYDLVRFGVGDRAEADRLLYRDMMMDCSAQRALGGDACRAIAHWTATTLEVGDATGFDPEPVTQGA